MLDYLSKHLGDIFAIAYAVLVVGGVAGLFLFLFLYWPRYLRKLLIGNAKKGNTKELKRFLDSLNYRRFINIRDKDGMTPLMHAIQEGHSDAAELLIARGADVTFRNSAGLTALDLAKTNKLSHIVSLLEKETEDAKLERPPADFQKAPNPMLHELRDELVARLVVLIQLIWLLLRALPIAITLSIALYFLGWRGISHSMFAAFVAGTWFSTLRSDLRELKSFVKSERDKGISGKALISNASTLFLAFFGSYVGSIGILWAAMAGIAVLLSKTIWPSALEIIFGFGF